MVIKVYGLAVCLAAIYIAWGRNKWAAQEAVRRTRLSDDFVPLARALNVVVGALSLAMAVVVIVDLVR